ncbi:MAG TPA: nitroreductase, partial [Clostridiales bacterium]|nr:nitroreductase [Clostridiales bacterium]
MTLTELLKRTRSYRSFDRSVPVTREDLAELVACIRYAPSSMNAQMLKFRPVTDPAECDTVLRATRWAAKLTDITLPPKGHEPAAYILVCADRRVLPNADRFDTDAGIAAEVLMLAATEAGLGGCIIGSFDASALSALLPDGTVPKLVLAVGKPDETVRLCDP